MVSVSDIKFIGDKARLYVEKDCTTCKRKEMLWPVASLLELGKILSSWYTSTLSCVMCTDEGVSQNSESPLDNTLDPKAEPEVLNIRKRRMNFGG